MSFFFSAGQIDVHKVSRAQLEYRLLEAVDKFERVVGKGEKGCRGPPLRLIRVGHQPYVPVERSKSETVDDAYSMWFIAKPDVWSETSCLTIEYYCHFPFTDYSSSQNYLDCWIYFNNEIWLTIHNMLWDVGNSHKLLTYLSLFTYVYNHVVLWVFQLTDLELNS